MTTANCTVPPERLEYYVRSHLNSICARLIVNPEPLLLTITNLPEDYLEMVSISNVTGTTSSDTSSRKVPFTRSIYIDRSDFKEEADASFYRLSIGKHVGLLNLSHPIKATSIVRDATGTKSLSDVRTSCRSVVRV